MKMFVYAGSAFIELLEAISKMSLSAPSAEGMALPDASHCGGVASQRDLPVPPKDACRSLTGWEGWSDIFLKQLLKKKMGKKTHHVRWPLVHEQKETLYRTDLLLFN